MIGDRNNFPSFLKGLTNIIIKERKVIKVERKKDFNYKELLNLFTDTSSIILMKNPNPISLVEEKQGFNIVIKMSMIQDYRLITIQGIVKDDILELYKTNNIIIDKIKILEHYINYEISNVPNTYKLNFLNILNVRDILVYKKEEIGNIIKKRYNDYKQLRMKTLGNLINDFLISSKFRKY